jgi:hypothetical protein
MRKNPERRPIRIKANSIELGVPTLDIDVSAQHRIVIQNPSTALLFGEDSVMVRAKHLTGSIAERLIPSSPVSYFHLLLDEHDMVIANGLESESFQPSLRNYLGLPTSMKDTLNSEVDHELLYDLFCRPDAMTTLRANEVLVLVAYMNGVRRKGVPQIARFDGSERKLAA